MFYEEVILPLTLARCCWGVLLCTFPEVYALVALLLGLVILGIFYQMFFECNDMHSCPLGVNSITVPFSRGMRLRACSSQSQPYALDCLLGFLRAGLSGFARHSLRPTATGSYLSIRVLSCTGL